MERRTVNSGNSRRERLIAQYSSYPEHRMVGEGVSAGQIVEALTKMTRFGVRIMELDRRLHPFGD